jgi:DNA polymerase-3 subunit epsilon
VVDTLKLARELHPGRKNSMDVLCDRYSIDNTRRTLHGALLDAELLAEVYLAMTRGQESLLMDLEHAAPGEELAQAAGERPELLVISAPRDELAEHEKILKDIARESKGRCLWLAAASSVQ